MELENLAIVQSQAHAEDPAEGRLGGSSLQVLQI